MTSEITASFRQDLGQLSPEIRAQARKAYRLWMANPHHPGLQFKKVHAREPIWSVRVGLHYRAVGILHGESMIWFFIGSHARYDQLLKTW